MIADLKDTAESKPRSAGSYDSGGTSALAVSIDNEDDKQAQDSLDQNSDPDEFAEPSPAQNLQSSGTGAEAEGSEPAPDEPVFAEDPGLAPASLAADRQSEPTPDQADQPETLQIFQDNLATESVFAEDSDAVPPDEDGLTAPASSDEVTYIENADAALSAETVPDSPSSPAPIAEFETAQEAASLSEYNQPFDESSASQPDDLPLDESVVDELEKPAEISLATEISATEDTTPVLAAELSPDNSMAASAFEEATIATEPMEEPMNEYGMNAMRESAAQTEAAYENTFRMFEQASNSFRTAFDDAGQCAAKLTFKFFEFAQANAESNMELAREYATVRSIPEVLDVQAAYMKRQMELLTTQVGELREITTELASKSAKPFKEQMDHSIKQFQHHQ